MSVYALTVVGIDEPLFVRELHGREQLGAAYHIEVTATLPPNAAPLHGRFDELLGADFTLVLGSDGHGDGQANGDEADDDADDADDADNAGKRTLQGAVEALRWSGGGYVLTLAPQLAQLSLSARERLAVAVSAVDITKALMEPLAGRIDERLQAPPPPRAQWLHHADSDLAWMTQVLAEQGVQWWLEHDEQGAASLVLADHPGAHRAILGETTLPYGHGAEANLDGPASVYAASLRAQLAADVVTLRTVDVENPETDLTVQYSEGRGGFELYRYGDSYADKDAGKALARRRLAQARRDRLVLHAKSNCRRLEVGRRFTLENAPHAPMNGDWVVTRTAWSGWQPLADEAYGSNANRSGSGQHGQRGQHDNVANRETITRPVFEVAFEAVPAADGYAPALQARGRRCGVLRATVSGHNGSDISPDALGRVTTRYAFDRDGANDETASAPTRALQPAMSGGLLLPRVGWEVLVAFGGGRHDMPIVVGRLDNGGAATAEALPANKVRSAMGSPTSPGGGHGNRLTLDDAAGSEGFNLSTAGDYNERTENNKSCSVAASETTTVGADQVTTAGALSIGVKADQSLSVGGGRDVSAADGIVIQCSSESVSIAGARAFVVGGDYHTGIGDTLTRTVGGIKSVTAVAAESLMVNGAMATTIGGALVQSGATVSVTVGGASRVTAGGSISISCAKYSLGASIVADTFGALSIKAGGAVAITARAAMSLSLGACSMKAPTIVIKATGSLTVTGGGASLAMTPASITFTGAFKAAQPEVSSGGVVKHG